MVSTTRIDVTECTRQIAQKIHDLRTLHPHRQFDFRSA